MSHYNEDDYSDSTYRRGRDDYRRNYREPNSSRSQRYARDSERFNASEGSDAYVEPSQDESHDWQEYEEYSQERDAVQDRDYDEEQYTKYNRPNPYHFPLKNVIDAVNDLLNTKYPHKALNTKSQFDEFHHLLIERVPEPTRAFTDRQLKSYLFYAGVTLLGHLAPRSERPNAVALDSDQDNSADNSSEAIDDDDSELIVDPTSVVTSSDGETTPAASGSRSFAEEYESYEPVDMHPGFSVDGDDSHEEAHVEEANATQTSPRQLELFDVHSPALRPDTRRKNNEPIQARASSATEEAEEPSLAEAQSVARDVIHLYFPSNVIHPGVEFAEFRRFMELNFPGKRLTDDRLKQYVSYAGASVASIGTDDVTQVNQQSVTRSVYVKIANHVLSTTFPDTLFLPDLSDFRRFRIRFEQEAGDAERLTDDELKEIFLAAGGRFYEEVAPVKPQRKLVRSVLIRKVLQEHFPAGLDPKSSEDLLAFRKFAAELGTEFDQPEDKLVTIIRRCSFTFHDKLYSVSDDNRRRVKDSIVAPFTVGARVIYYQKLYAKNGWFSRKIEDNADLFVYLVADSFPEYRFYPHFMLSEDALLPSGFEFLLVKSEIERVWGNLPVITGEELASRLFVPQELIEWVLAYDTSTYVVKDNGFARKPNSSELTAAELKTLNAQFVEAFARVPSDYRSVSGSEFALRLNGEEVESKDEESNDDSEAEPVVKRRYARRAKASLEDNSPSEVANDTVATQPEEAPVESQPRRRGRPKGSTKGSSVAKSSSLTKSTGRASRRKTSDTSDEQVSDETRSMIAQNPEIGQMIARVLARSFPEGFDLSSSTELTKFKHILAKHNPDFNCTKPKLLELVKVVGFLCEGRYYVISKRTSSTIKETVNEWFQSGNLLIYFDVFLARLNARMGSQAIPNVAVLKNRLRKFYPDYFFHEDYFEEKGRRGLKLNRKVLSDLCNNWDGSVARRIGDLLELIYVPQEVLSDALKNDANFTASSNGYWTFAEKKVPLKRKTSAASKKRGGRG
ncbi:MAG: hypothetical protein Q4G03_06020 [Planctomycetia bacterium]|nr:hypothetical protein [Planctomycetia bacterium]